MRVAHVFANESFESRGIKLINSSKKSRITVVPYLKKKGESYLGFLIKTADSILRENIETIHAHRISGFLPAILVKMLRPKTRIIYDKHDIHKYDFIFDRLLFFADHVIVCSELHLKQIRKMKKESSIIQNYSDFAPVSRKTAENVRKELKLGSKELFVLFQGSIVPSYGLDLLVKSLPKLDENARICIIGWIKDKDYWDSLKRDFSGKIRYIGSRKYEEMNKYVGSADAGVVLFDKSRLTTFGNPAKLFEFIACRIPVICTDVQSVSPVIKKYGNGIVVNGESELADAINKMADRKTREAYAKKSPNLSWDSEFKKYLKILNKK
ncbi:MAG: glycosyltransferase family 4 protein [Candidatus Paceibacterota bacterium]